MYAVKFVKIGRWPRGDLAGAGLWGFSGLAGLLGNARNPRLSPGASLTGAPIPAGRCLLLGTVGALSRIALLTLERFARTRDGAVCAAVLTD